MNRAPPEEMQEAESMRFLPSKGGCAMLASGIIGLGSLTSCSASSIGSRKIRGSGALLEPSADFLMHGCEVLEVLICILNY